jgi:undecaprenyl diphosphate synthase
MVDLYSLADEGTEEMQILRSLDLSRLPRHVAIIMDGNGRWAGRRHLPRVAGHRAGIASVRDVVEASARLGPRGITLYAFSKENWKRPRAEVETLMQLLREYLRRELDTLQKNRIRFRVIGAIEELVPPSGRSSSAAWRRRRGTTGCSSTSRSPTEARGDRRGLPPAADGGRGRQVDRASLDERPSPRSSTRGRAGSRPLIRTSGELRVSNFLLWQIAYAEIWVTETLWPDFRRRELFRAIADFQKRNRRYGGIGRGRRRGGTVGSGPSGLTGALARS